MNTKSPFIKQVPFDDLEFLIETVMKMTGISDPKEAVKLINCGNWKLVKTGEVDKYPEENFGRVDINVPKDTTNYKQFFSGTKGVEIDVSFVNLFLTEFSHFSGPISLFNCNAGKIRSADDLKAQLGEGYVFKPEEFCPILATLIQMQIGKKTGYLRSHGSSNIFFVLNKNKDNIHIVQVRFVSLVLREWRVRVLDVNDYRLRTEDLIFFPKRSM